MECDQPSLDFVVVPVVGTIGEDPERLTPPGDDLLVEIKDALEAFQLSAALLH